MGNSTETAPAQRLCMMRWMLLTATLAMTFLAGSAQAIPAFNRQTGQTVLPATQEASFPN